MMRVRELTSAGASRGRSSLPRAAIVSHSLGSMPSELLCAIIASLSAFITSVRYASLGSLRIGSTTVSAGSLVIAAADPVALRAYRIHIGLDSIGYCASRDRWDDVALNAEWLLALA